MEQDINETQEACLLLVGLGLHFFALLTHNNIFEHDQKKRVRFDSLIFNMIHQINQKAEKSTP